MKKLLPMFLFGGCVGIRMDDSIPLGGQFRYIQDYPQTIIYHETKGYDGTGLNVVPPVVQAYNFYDRYIIARSCSEDVMNKTNNEKKEVQYWIIDKSETFTLVKPMDSVNFFNQLSQLKITLNLK